MVIALLPVLLAGRASPSEKNLASPICIHAAELILIKPGVIRDMFILPLAHYHRAVYGKDLKARTSSTTAAISQYVSLSVSMDCLGFFLDFALGIFILCLSDGLCSSRNTCTSFPLSDLIEAVAPSRRGSDVSQGILWDMPFLNVIHRPQPWNSEAQVFPDRYDKRI